jgi:hypothetical protein
MQRTLERELKVPETAVGEAVGRAVLGPWITR